MNAKIRNLHYTSALAGCTDQPIVTDGMSIDSISLNYRVTQIENPSQCHQ